MRITILIVLLVLANTLGAGGEDPIQQVNAQVAEISDAIASGELAVVEMNEVVESEGSPPDLKFYYRQDRLLAVQVDVGHETWSNRFSFYFYENGQIMKFLKTTLDRPDNPPKLAVIYEPDGSVLWKNTDDTYIDPDELKALFDRYQATKGKFLDY